MSVNVTANLVIIHFAKSRPDREFRVYPFVANYCDFCNTLKHIVMQCNVVQHVASHWNTSHHASSPREKFEYEIRLARCPEVLLSAIIGKPLRFILQFSITRNVSDQSRINLYF